MTLKKTPLHDRHVALKAKMVDFGGWSMPAQYEHGVISEHRCVRTKAGLFDVSHMGEIMVTGPGALGLLQKLTTNNLDRLSIGKGHYTTMLYPSGGIVDDLILYQVDDHTYLLCVNAANIDKDFQWIFDHKEDFEVEIDNQSSEWGQLALQGPKSPEVIAEVFPQAKTLLQDLPYMGIQLIPDTQDLVYCARTGYTGEKGYELYIRPSMLPTVWDSLLELGAKEGLQPIGLGARDTLRLEASLLLYGQDISQEVNPLEAGIKFAVKINEKDFIGKDALLQASEQGIERKLVGFLMQDPGIPRMGMDLYKDGQKCGQVTSGSYLPTLDQPGGMALVSRQIALDDVVEIDVRGKRKLAKVTKRPLYSARVK